MKALIKHRRLVLALAVFGVLAGAACSYDFHAFDPVDPGSEFDASLDHSNGNDTGSGSDDAGQDADANLPTCTVRPPPKCLAEAGACGSNCESTRTNCRNGCLLDSECRKRCDEAALSCKGGCQSTCVNCTADAGCEMGDVRRCDDAVNGRDAGPDA